MRGQLSTNTLLEGYRIDTDDDRIELIKEQVFESVQDPLVLWVARAITRDCGRDDNRELEAIYAAVKDGPIPLPDPQGHGTIETPGLRFLQDPRFTDAYPSAGKILRWHTEAGGEDCDGHTILVCSLLNSLGWLTGAVIASKDGEEFVHVFPVVAWPKDDPIGGQWVPLDTTVEEATVGWWPPRSLVKRMRVYGFTPEPGVRGREIRR